jgi:hypothetical protein
MIDIPGARINSEVRITLIWTQLWQEKCQGMANLPHFMAEAENGCANLSLVALTPNIAPVPPRKSRAI